MLKLILKNLWARRRRNGWLLAELIIVGVISWVILDPVIVLTHDRHIPMGYDVDRLCLISLGALQPQAPGYDEQVQDSVMMMNGYLNMVRRVCDFEGVELTTPVLGFCYPNSEGNGNNELIAEGDTLKHPVMFMNFLPHTNFFETYGFCPGKGRSLEQLSDYDYTQNDIVLSENTAQNIFGTVNVEGKRCVRYHNQDTTYLPVIGTVGTFKAYSDWRPSPVYFSPLLVVDIEDIPEYARILVRLREGVSMERFLHDFRPWMVKELRAGNLFARSIQSYDDIIRETEAGSSTPIYRRNLAMAIFFLVNLCLGVIGTFWLQTRTRCEEVGVMLSFGATPGYVMRLLMGEGVVLTVFASFISFLLYLQYAIKEGLDEGMNWMREVKTYWVSDFTSHFVIVSLIILLILLVVVLIGIYIPARSISRITPTDALRDE